jgi:hypothetical protein
MAAVAVVLILVTLALLTLDLAFIRRERG